jgi:hypothetical protein
MEKDKDNSSEEDEDVPQVVSPERSKKHSAAEDKARMARKKSRYEVVVHKWTPIDKDPLVELLVEVLHKGSQGFCTDLVPYAMEMAPTAIVSVQNGIGAAGTAWGLNLQGVSLPRQEDSFNDMMIKLFGDQLAHAGINVIHGLDHWLIPVRLHVCLFAICHSSPHTILN